MAKKIMVVDDDPLIVKYIVNILTDNGYETFSASDGVEAFEALKTQKPDMITLDLQMTDEWGPQFYRRLAKEDEFKDILAFCKVSMRGYEAQRILNAAGFDRVRFIEGGIAAWAF